MVVLMVESSLQTPPRNLFFLRIRSLVLGEAQRNSRLFSPKRAKIHVILLESRPLSTWVMWGGMRDF